MTSANQPFLASFLPALLIALGVIFTCFPYTSGHESSSEGRRDETGRRRMLLSFRETPAGGNVSFECSPSGPCVPCLYSEKSDEGYRCSETGYRIPLKCVEIEDGSKGENSKKSQKGRSALEKSYSHKKFNAMLHDPELSTEVRHGRLLDDSSTSKGGTQAYITYRSCIPAVNEEKLTLFGFEGIIMFLLLISGSVVYFRRKGTVALSGVGAVRVQTNSRF